VGLVRDDDIDALRHSAYEHVELTRLLVRVDGDGAAPLMERHTPTCQAGAVPGDGYDKNFFATCIDESSLNPEQLADAIIVDGYSVIEYTHFSLGMNRSRCLAQWMG